MVTQFNPFPVLESKRLCLTHMDKNHTSALFSYFSNKKNFLNVDMPVHESLEETQNYIDKMTQGVENNRWIIWAICLKESSEIIGTISIWNLDKDKKQAELGYGIFPKFRRKGYMRETMDVVLDYAFNKMKAEKIEAYTSHDNLASVEFLRNMKFSFIKTIEDEYSNGKLMDVFEVTKLR